MVEPVVTISAVALLATYLKGLTEEAGRRTAEGLDDGARHALRRIYDAVKRRLSGDSYGEQTLARVEESPDDERRRRALQDVLDEIAETDEAFASDLAALVREAKASAGGSIRIDDSGAVAVHGNVIMSGTNVAGRDLTLGAPPRRPSSDDI